MFELFQIFCDTFQIFINLKHLGGSSHTIVQLEVLELLKRVLEHVIQHVPKKDTV